MGEDPSSSKSVELGFAEKCDSWRLRSKFFPSKFGGKPAWLALRNLPDTLKCSCGEPLTFLLQVYAPLDDHPTAFHRTLFVFACQPCVDRKKPNSIVVYRSQLALVNEFYSDQPPDEVEAGSETPSAGDFHQLCCVCGCPGSQRCSLCKSRSYCSKQHQTIDWKKAHKFVCPGNAAKKQGDSVQLGESSTPKCRGDAADTLLTRVNGTACGSTTEQRCGDDDDDNNSFPIGGAHASGDAADIIADPKADGRLEGDESVRLQPFPLAQEAGPREESATISTGLNGGDLSSLNINWGPPADEKQKSTITQLSCQSKEKHVKENGMNPKNKKKKDKPARDYEHRGVLPEYDIETEPEEILAEERKEDTHEDLAKYLNNLDKDSIASMKEMAQCNEKDLKEIENISKGLDDKAFKRFKKIVDHYPEQVLRYCKDGDPLWVSNVGLPKEIPSCDNCGSSRKFEFQVMPHSLNLLKNDLLDWGTLAVYSCTKSCQSDNYLKEFVYRQDFSN